MNAVQARHQFGEQGFIGAAVAEILADGVDQRLAFSAQHIPQRFEPLLALRRGGHRVGGIGCTLGLEQGLEFFQWLLQILEVGNFSRHGHLRIYCCDELFRVYALESQMTSWRSDVLSTGG